MISIPAGVRVLLATQPVDFRRGAHGLAALAAGVLDEDPFSGAVLVFRAKRGDRVKILLWDGSGLILVWKQLQAGARFARSTRRQSLQRRIWVSLMATRAHFSTALEPLSGLFYVSSFSQQLF